MTVPVYASLEEHVEYVLDTGPFLCLGGAKSLRDAFKARCYGKTHWVQAVHDELVGHGLGKDAVAAAAREFDRRRKSHWLPTPVDFGSRGSDTDVEKVLTEVKRLAANRPGRGVSRRTPNADLGEAQSIVHAARTRHTFMSHDDSALRAAGQVRVPAVTLVDLARRMVADGHQKPRLLSDAFQALKQSGIDIGGKVSGPLDLTPRRRHPE